MLLPLISKEIMDKGLLAKNLQLVTKFSIISFALILMDQFIGIFETNNRAHINSLMQYSLAKTAFKHTLRLKIQYFNNTNFVELFNNISMDIGNVTRISDRATFYIVTSVFKIIGGIIGLLLIDWRLTILITLLVPVRYFLVKYLAKKRKSLIEEYLELNKDYSAWYGDTISGVKEIKLHGMDRLKTGQFIKKQRGIIKVNIKLAIIDKINELCEVTVFQIITNALYILGAYMVFQDTITVGGLFAFLTYSTYVTTPISAILNIGYSFSNILPSAKRLFDFLDMDHETYSGGKKLNKGGDTKIHGNIKFENVTFSYKQEEPVLKNVSFEMGAGEKVAIVGSNGSGKSTMINLLLRLYKPDCGRILLDGMDINELNLRDYRQHISVVSQDIYLFDTTVKENIAPSPSKNDFKIYKAAKQSNAHEFIEAMPDKYESRVGRNGVNLSGGERQKIAMARAFAKNSKILVMDEATSNCDMESEALVNGLLEDEFKDRTIIVITHKPDILRHVDRVIMLEDGFVKDVDSNEEIDAKTAIYSHYT
jgi:ABC-type multidrug transport system, ATPase and permease components